MKFLTKAPDGGENSGVMAYVLIEWKSLFSIMLLRFEKGTREAYHSHAFNAVTFWLKGNVREHHLDGEPKEFSAGWMKYTPRSTFHKVEALETTWALTLRGPWVDYWNEFRNGRYLTLTHGRKEVPHD